MKYQYKLNGEVLFETNDTIEFFSYLIKEENRQVRDSTLFRLLDQSKGYVANMVNSLNGKEEIE